MAYYVPGLYECVINGQGFDVSKDKRTPFFWLSFFPARLGDEEIEAPYQREVKLYLTDKTAERVVAQLRSLGWDGTSFRDLEPGGYRFEKTRFSVRCRHDQNGDNVYENWELPLPDGESREHKYGVAKKLDTLFEKALKTKSGGPATGKPTKEANASVEDAVVPDDDIPF